MTDAPVSVKEWQQGEAGPTCFCGKATSVMFVGSNDDKKWALVCFAHTPSEGASFCLPSDRPEKWPELTGDEMADLIERGEREHRLDETEEEP